MLNWKLSTPNTNSSETNANNGVAFCTEALKAQQAVSRQNTNNGREFGIEALKGRNINSPGCSKAKAWVNYKQPHKP
jgi:hypothetical protein